MMGDVWEWISKNEDAIYAGILSSCIAAAIVLSLQTFVLSLSGILVLFVSRRITAARLLGLDGDSLAYVVSGAIQTEQFGALNLIGSPDAAAANEMLRTIEDIAPRRTCKHFFCSVPHDLFLDEDVVTVGGPRYNTVTKTMLTQLSCGVAFGDDDSLVCGSERFGDEKSAAVDYGLVISTENPFNDSRRLVVIAGCGSHGVLAASHLVSTGSRFKKVQRDLTRRLRRGVPLPGRTNFIAIVRCACVGNDISMMELVKAQRI